MSLNYGFAITIPLILEVDRLKCLNSLCPVAILVLRQLKTKSCGEDDQSALPELIREAQSLFPDCHIGS